jgi:acetyl esterase/lipase
LQSAASRDRGEVAIPAFVLPYSSYASSEAREHFIREVLKPNPEATVDILANRRHYDAIDSDRVRRMRQRFDVSIEETRIGGVPVQIVTPAHGVAEANRHRVLLNLHGGAFLWGARSGSLVESIPIAATAGIRVIAIDYRMAPEAAYPAGSEDAAAVYGAVLAQYRPEAVGLYGCSAGAYLAAQSLVWFQRHNLPMPGAVGMFCLGAGPPLGDSAMIGQAATAQRVDPNPRDQLAHPYFRGVRADDAGAFPLTSPEALRRFPPALLISGTRDFALSSVLATQAALTREGVDAELHVWDGMWHAFMADPEPRESEEAYHVIARFFDRRLAH